MADQKYSYSDGSTYTDGLTLERAREFQRLQGGGLITPMGVSPSNAGEFYLQQAVTAQSAFWDALGELEGFLGVDVDGTQDLSDVTIEDLLEGDDEDDRGGAMNRILITMDGGIIQDIMADQEVDVHVLDFDVEGAELEELTKVSGNECYWNTPSVNVSTASIDRALEEAMLNSNEEGRG